MSIRLHVKGGVLSGLHELVYNIHSTAARVAQVSEASFKT